MIQRVKGRTCGFCYRVAFSGNDIGLRVIRKSASKHRSIYACRACYEHNERDDHKEPRVVYGTIAKNDIFWKSRHRDAGHEVVWKFGVGDKKIWYCSKCTEKLGQEIFRCESDMSFIDAEPFSFTTDTTSNGDWPHIDDYFTRLRS